MFREGYGVPDEERVALGKGIWKILIEEVAQIGLVGLSPASMGVRVVKNNMGNVPGRIYNSPASKNPASATPYVVIMGPSCKRLRALDARDLALFPRPYAHL